MNHKKHYTLNSILKSLHLVQHNEQAQGELQQLNNIVLSVLDEKTRQHCAVIGIKGPSLLLTASSPAWQHNVRFYQHEILTKLQNIASFKHVIEVKTRIDNLMNQDLVRKSNKYLPNPSINENSAQALTDIADGIQNISQELSEALKRLANRANKRH